MILCDKLSSIECSSSRVCPNSLTERKRYALISGDINHKLGLYQQFLTVRETGSMGPNTKEAEEGLGE